MAPMWMSWWLPSIVVSHVFQEVKVGSRVRVTSVDARGLTDVLFDPDGNVESYSMETAVPMGLEGHVQNSFSLGPATGLPCWRVQFDDGSTHLMWGLHLAVVGGGSQPQAIEEKVCGQCDRKADAGRPCWWCGTPV